jgi:hypothetical protein
MREIKVQLHRETQALCDAILRVYVCPKIYTLAKQVTESCLNCRKVNKQALRGQDPGGRSPGFEAFQSIQVDYTELPEVGHLKSLLITGGASNQLD